MMKTKCMLLLSALFLAGLYSHAGNNAAPGDTLKKQKKEIRTSEFPVRGNCGQCKDRIEKSAYRLKGVKDVSWDVDTKIFTVIYDAVKISEGDIREAILKAGHDVGEKLAPDSAYSLLPDCCKYRDRKH